MCRHAVVFIAVLFEALKTYPALQSRDINRFIEKLQRLEATYNNGRDDQSQAVENKGYVAISSRELDELINQAANDVFEYNQDRDGNNDGVSRVKGSNDYIIDNDNKNIQQLLYSNSEAGQRKLSKGVLSSGEINYIGLDPDNAHIIDSNDNKLFLILNPRANLKEKDFKDITGLLSRLLLDSAKKKIYPKQDNKRIHKEVRYKGFVMADGARARRRNRESKELYSLQDSSEDFKTKRVRSEYGGAGGRTPIPYIGHRDIYERE